MKNIHRNTYALTVMMVMILVFFAKSSSGNVRTTAQQQTDKQAQMQRYLEARRTFAMVDSNEPEPSDPAKRAVAREKQKRRNTVNAVMTIPNPQVTEMVLLGEGGEELSALPVKKSDVIIVGNVVSAEAHMSGNKMNVVSEFSIHVEKVYKPSESIALVPGSSIMVERFGGIVRYPSGQTILYRFAGTSMPKISGRYLFFLTSISQSNDYEILTGYELGETVSPLDASYQFEALRGLETSELLKRLDDLLVPAK